MIEIKENTTAKTAANQLYGLPVETVDLFSDHRNFYNSRIEKRQRKFLSKLTFLAPYLEEGEKILHVIESCSPVSFVEQLLTGALLYALKRSLLVISNRRILHVPLALGRSCRSSVSQIMYADCRYIGVGWSSLIVRYKSGKTEKFRCLGGKNRKKIRTLLKDRPLEGRTSLTLERMYLCPSCTKPLIQDVYVCPGCSLKFKTKFRASVLSIIFPGGGYFYTRHSLLGVLAAVMEASFAFLLALSSYALFVSSPTAPRGLIQAVVICAIILVFEKLSTMFFSNKCIEEFIPRKRRVDVQIDKVLADKSAPHIEEMLATGWRSV